MKSLFSIAVLIAALSFSPSGAEAERFKLQLSNFGGSGQAGNPQGWQAWAPRAELQPRCYVDTAQFRSQPSALAISGNGNAAEYGGWSYRVSSIQPGRHYRLTAHYRTKAVSHEQLRVVTRLDWQAASHPRLTP